MKFFDSDYLEGCAPEILEALSKTNFEQTEGYGKDFYSERAKEKIKKACNCQEADVWFLVGGTQVNSTVLDGLLKVGEGVISCTTGHIAGHEAGAIETFGHKVITLPHENGKLTAEKVKEYLTMLNIEFEVDPNLVRGLDYYNHTAFEIMSTAEGFGAITTLAGGGRYNGLVAELGGPDSPGIGYAMSIERLLLAMEAEKIAFPDHTSLDVYLVAMGEEAKKKVTELTFELRQNKISADMDYLDRKVKAQMKSADRLKAKAVIVIGEDELEKQSVMLKDLTTGTQQLVPFTSLIDEVKKLTEAK